MENELKKKLVRDLRSQQLNLEVKYRKILEKEGEQKAVKALSDPSANANTFLNIIKEGAKEFEQKTGRTMTYSEMRETYG